MTDNFLLFVLSAGATVLSSLQSSGMDTSYIRKLGEEYHPATRTAQYVAVNDGEKSLMLAMADMNIFSSHSFQDHWRSVVETAKPRWLIVDGNWGANDVKAWVRAGKSQPSCKVAFEPVSAEKSTRLFQPFRGVSPLTVFPEASVDLASPNEYELRAMHEAAKTNGYFDSTEWFQVIDAFGMRGARDRFVQLAGSALTDAGIPVQSVQLLPYIPTLITKLGPKGVLLTSILGRDDPRLYDRDSQEFILTRSAPDHPTVGGIYMRLFPAAENVENIVSVNGAGDTFLGVLVAGLAQGGNVERLIDVAQKGARMTLKSAESVSPDLARIENDLKISWRK